MNLNKYVIDVCVPVTDDDGNNRIQMKSYIAVGEDPMEAITKFMDEAEDDHVLYFEGEKVTHVVVGMNMWTPDE